MRLTGNVIIVIAIVLAILPWGCRESSTKPAPARTVANDTVKSKNDSKRPDTETGKFAIPEKIQESDVRRVLSAWLKAQNEGDFDSYASLYANRFDGIKRAGKKTFQFDRKGWLKDRKGMFNRQMTVTADDAKFFTGPVTAKVRFEQTWSNGKYSDKGPKILQLIREDGALRIFREEMLRSEMAARKGKVKPPAFLESFYLTTDEQYAVLGTMSASTGPGDSKHLGGYIAEKSLHPQEGQSVFRDRVVGGIFVGYADGTVREVKITDVVGIAKNIFHSGVPQLWREQGYDASQRGLAIWQAAAENNTLYYAAKLPEKNTPAVWAMRDLDKAPVVYSPFDPTETEKSTVVAALQATPESAAIQRRFTKSGYKGKWWDYVSEIELKGFSRSPENRYVFVQISSGNGCGDFYDTLFRFYNISTGEAVDVGAPQISDFTKSPFVDSFIPQAALDLDRDGFPEFVRAEKMMYKSGNTWFVHELQIPYGDCPC